MRIHRESLKNPLENPVQDIMGGFVSSMMDFLACLLIGTLFTLVFVEYLS